MFWRKSYASALIFLVVFVITIGAFRNMESHETLQIRSDLLGDHRMGIGGSWHEIRSSLGLKSLSPYVVFPTPPARAARFDLKRKRREEAQHVAYAAVPPLRIVPEALAQPKLTLHEIIAAWQNFASSEGKSEIDQKIPIASKSSQALGRIKTLKQKRPTDAMRRPVP